jgi:hypothetical protein
VSGYRIVLGPCRCQGCDRPVYWDTFAWQDRTERGAFRTHDCVVSERVFGYNTDVGSGDEHDRIARDASPKATTLTAGVAASIEVVAR